MEAEFWHEKWRKSEIGFHNQEAHHLLVKHLHQASTQPPARVFLPLCGKTLDIAWLMNQGYQIAGAELSELAVTELFQDLKQIPKIADLGDLKHYQATNIDIFVGNIFNLTEKHLGPIDLTYDRAALVALPITMRERYTIHLKTITNQARQFLISFDYNQSEQNGPPFSVPKTTIHDLYANNYAIQQLASTTLEGGLKGKCAAKEEVWLLKSK